MQRGLGLRTFVETGTLRGDTAQWASGHFAKVITIEADTKLYEQASARFARAGNVDVRLGSSPEVLPSVISELREPALFWLDAHWCGPGTAGATDNECPLVQELDIIDGGSHQHILLIDDARLFMNPPPAPHRAADWPPLPDVIERLRRRFTDVYLSIQDDVIFRVPLGYAGKFETLLKEVAQLPLAAISERVKGVVRWMR